MSSHYLPLVCLFSPHSEPELRKAAAAVDKALSGEGKRGHIFLRDGAPDLYRQVSFAKSDLLLKAVCDFTSALQRAGGVRFLDTLPAFSGLCPAHRAAIADTLECWDAEREEADFFKRLQIRKDGRGIITCHLTAVSFLYVHAQPAARRAA